MDREWLHKRIYAYFTKLGIWIKDAKPEKLQLDMLKHQYESTFEFLEKHGVIGDFPEPLPGDTDGFSKRLGKYLIDCASWILVEESSLENLNTLYQQTIETMEFLADLGFFRKHMPKPGMRPYDVSIFEGVHGEAKKGVNEAGEEVQNVEWKDTDNIEIHYNPYPDKEDPVGVAFSTKTPPRSRLKDWRKPRVVDAVARPVKQDVNITYILEGERYDATYGIRSMEEKPIA